MNCDTAPPRNRITCAGFASKLAELAVEASPLFAFFDRTPALARALVFGAHRVASWFGRRAAEREQRPRFRPLVVRVSVFLHAAVVQTAHSAGPVRLRYAPVDHARRLRLRRPRMSRRESPGPCGACVTGATESSTQRSAAVAAVRRARARQRRAVGQVLAFLQPGAVHVAESTPPRRGVAASGHRAVNRHERHRLPAAGHRPRPFGALGGDTPTCGTAPAREPRPGPDRHRRRRDRASRLRPATKFASPIRRRDGSASKRPTAPTARAAAQQRECRRAGCCGSRRFPNRPRVSASFGPEQTGGHQRLVDRDTAGDKFLEGRRAPG